MEDDQQYLKDYIKHHPDNKMGWYLLGKEYEAQGKLGKAQYCYAQAGEVYEAFEKKSIRLDVPANNDEDEKRSRQPRLYFWLRVVLATLLAMFLITYIPFSEVPVQRVQTKAPSEPPAAVAPLSDAERVLYTHPLAAPNDAQELLQAVLLPRVNKWKYTIVAKGQPTDDKRWIDWARGAMPLLSLERSDVTGQPDVRYYDAATCNCKAADPARAAKLIESWSRQQEEEAVLRSAIAAYRSLYGAAAPDSIDKLTGDYPRNVLPGYTDYMRSVYPQLAAAAAQGAGGGSAASSPAEGGAGPSSAVTPLAAKLEIVVDKASHRLALVSGSIIVRSYAVGLGGDKTPEGTFAITEKVKNPNGRSDGDFGSRGMTLSDTQYAIHGTNQPNSIGKDQSLGCVRMNQEDIEELFDMAPLGTKVTIGRDLLPASAGKEKPTFALPPLRNETNPNKVYKWLD